MSITNPKYDNIFDQEGQQEHLQIRLEFYPDRKSLEIMAFRQNIR